MNRVSLLRAGSVLVFACLSGRAADEVSPTSVVVSKTLTPVFGAGPVSKPLVSAEAYSNFRMVLEYDAAVPSRVALGKDASVELPAGSGRRVELAYEHIPSSAPHVRVWIDGKADGEGRAIGKGRQQEAIEVADLESSRQVLRFDRDFTAMVMFRPGKRGGTLFAKAMPEGKWIPNAKALYLRNNRLIYDIAFLGAMTGESVVAPGKEHVAVLVSEGGNVRMFLDGKMDGSRSGFTAQDPAETVFKLGAATTNFGGELDGSISGVRFWRRALNADEIGSLSKGNEKSVNTPDFDWNGSKAGVGGLSEFGAVPGYPVRPTLEPGKGFVLHRAFVQPLSASDHGELVGGWNEESLKNGETIYNQICRKGRFSSVFAYFSTSCGPA